MASFFLTKLSWSVLSWTLTPPELEGFLQGNSTHKRSFLLGVGQGSSVAVSHFQPSQALLPLFYISRSLSQEVFLQSPENQFSEFPSRRFAFRSPPAACCLDTAQLLRLPLILHLLQRAATHLVEHSREVGLNHCLLPSHIHESEQGLNMDCRDQMYCIKMKRILLRK